MIVTIKWKKEDDDFAHYGMLSKPNSGIAFSNSPWTREIYTALQAGGYIKA
jgi:hypothetical protein